MEVTPVITGSLGAGRVHVEARVAAVGNEAGIAASTRVVVHDDVGIELHARQVILIDHGAKIGVVAIDRLRAVRSEVEAIEDVEAG